MALYSGARIQTICTIRVFHIKEILAKQIVNSTDDTFKLRVGGKSIIDTKGNFESNLKIPGNPPSK